MSIRRYKRNFVLLLILIFCSVMGISQQTKASGDINGAVNNKVRVGWYESPFNSFDAGGNRTGYAYEYQQKIAGYTGWEYEYVEGGWYELLQQLKDGELDLLTDVSKTPEREKEMLFSDLPMGTEVYYIIVDSLTTTISGDDVSSLNGKKIGIAKNSIQEEQYLEWEKKHGVESEIIELTGTDLDNVYMLETGEIDAYLGVGGFEDYLENAETLFMTGSSDYYFVINKDKPELKAQIDKAMMDIRSANWYYTQELAKKYLSGAGAQRFLTAEEQEWLQEHGDVRVGYLDHLLPFSEADPSTGDVKGLLKDFINSAGENLKNGSVSFQSIAYNSPEEMYNALKNGELDCIFPISISVPQAEQMQILLTDEITKTEALAVVRLSDVGNFDPGQEHSVAVVSGEYTDTSIASNFFPGWKQVSYGTLEERLKAVAQGKVDCVLMSNYQAYAEADLLEEYKLTTIATGENPSVSFGVKREYLPLYSILIKLTKAMPDAQVNTALVSYVRKNENVSFASFVKSNLLAVLTILIGILVIILILLARSQQSVRRTRKLNETLLQTEKRAEKASQAKSDFLFNMSHDIRTPMNAIVGYADMALRHPDDNRVIQDSLHKISAASDQMLSLINDILDMSRIESGKMELTLEPASVYAAGANIANMFAAQTAEKEINLQVSEKNLTHDVVMCDQQMITRILMNLISNAVKFTPKGGTITLTAEELETNRANDGATYRFTVADNGIGMSKEFIGKIFEPFERERTSTVSKQQGTGLGMAIVHKIVMLMNGTITIESEEGKGSAFTVDLPLKFSQEKPENTKAVINHLENMFEGKTVLLVEDMIVNRELAKTILEEQKLTVDTAENGQIAVDMFTQNPDRYAAILMDIQMPVMDGYTATETIRAMDIPQAKSVPIIAMTANAFAEDRQHALEVGMNDHLAKPIDVNQLNRTLKQFIR